MFLVVTISCENNSPFEANETNQAFERRIKGRTTTLDVSDTQVITEEDTLLMTDEGVARFHKKDGEYFGVQIGHYSGSALWIDNWSLTPPDGWEYGKNVTITMTVEKKDNELIHTFGPHGSTFAPGATLYLSWEMLGTDTAKLFYIDDNGDYIEQQSEDVDYKNKWFKITIHHFSRYAVAYGR